MAALSAQRTALLFFVLTSTVGCATWRPPTAATVDEYAAKLDGSDLKEAEIRKMLEPVERFCVADGGQELRQTRKQRAGSVVANGWNAVGGFDVPSELVCTRGSEQLWAFKLSYETPYGSSRTRVYASVLTAEQLAARRADEAAARAEALRIQKERDTERRSQLEEQQRMRRAEMEDARMASAARLERFKRELKPGDRFEWKVPGRDFYGAGMVVRLDGELAFVQFDNLTISGSATRYVRRADLMPPEGRAPRGAKFDID